METKIQIKTTLGKILFEYKKENNTVKDTLVEANLCDVDLCSANLRGADLRSADLCGAALRGANLCGADLKDIKNKKLAILPLHCKWSVGIKGDSLVIGCKTKTFKEWEDWFKGKERFSTKRNTEDFKRIEATYKAYRAYYEFMKE